MFQSNAFLLSGFPFDTDINDFCNIFVISKRFFIDTKLIEQALTGQLIVQDLTGQSEGE